MTRPLKAGTLIVDPADTPLLAFLLAEGVRTVGQRRQLPTQVAQLLAAARTAAADARSASGPAQVSPASAKPQAATQPPSAVKSASGPAAVFPSMPTASSWTTVEDAAERLSVSTRQIRRLCASGQILAERHGRDWAIVADSLQARGR